MPQLSAAWMKRAKNSWQLCAQHASRPIAVFLASTILSHLPVIVYSFVALGCQAAVLLYLFKPWHHAAKRSGSVLLNQQQWVRVGINGAFMALVYVLASKGLQGCGAIRFLVLEHSHFIVAGVVAIAMKGRRDKKDHMGSKQPWSLSKLSSTLGPEGLLALSYFLLLWPSPDDPGATENPELEEIGLVWNVLLLLCASLLKAVRERFASKLAKEVGGEDRLHALSVGAAAGFMVPLVFLDVVGEAVVGADFDYSFLSLSTIVSIVFIVILMDLVPLLERKTYTKVVTETVQCVSSLPVAFALLVYLRQTGSLWVVSSIEPTWWIALFACYFTAAGLFRKTSLRAVDSYLEFRANAASRLPLYSRGGDAASVGTGGRDLALVCSSGTFIRGSKRLLHHIWSDKDSLKIFIFLSINLSFMFVEVGVGLWTNSLGLISDAGHMFFDCGALFIGLYASYMGKWSPDAVYTYGYGRYEVLSGFVNGIFLIFIALFILTESIERITSPPELSTQGLLVTSVAGFLVNMVGLVFFHDHAHSHEGDSGCGGHGHSHGGDNENLHGVFLHILADTLGSLGVIVSSLLIEYKGWNIADPICSSLISILILMSVVPLLVNTSHTLLERPSDALNSRFVSCLAQIKAMQGVVEVRDPHCWRHSKGLVVASLHVTVVEESYIESVSTAAHQVLVGSGISDVAIQVCDVRTASVLQEKWNQGSSSLDIEGILHDVQYQGGCDHGHSHDGNHGHSHEVHGGTQSHHGHSHEVHGGTQSHHGHSHEVHGGTQSHHGHSHEVHGGTQSHHGHSHEVHGGTQSHEVHSGTHGHHNHSHNTSNTHVNNTYKEHSQNEQKNELHEYPLRANMPQDEHLNTDTNHGMVLLQRPNALSPMNNTPSNVLTEPEIDHGHQH